MIKFALELANACIMKLLIEAISETRNKKEGYSNVMMRRDGSYDEAATSMSSFFLGGDEKPGRPAWQVMDDKVIDKLGVKVGADLNELLVKAGKKKLAIQVFETTEPEAQAENVRLALTEKKNPSTEEVLTKNGKAIFHLTRLVTLDQFAQEGDIRIEHDSPIK